MKKKILAFLAIIGVVLIGTVSTAEGGRGHHWRMVRGDVDLVLNAGYLNPDSPTPNVSWTGTWQIDHRRAYDIVFFSEAPPMPIAGTDLVYWVEDWALYPQGTIEIGDDGVVGGFASDEFVAYGLDYGIGTPDGAYAMGRVTDADRALDPYHLFGRRSVGDFVTWYGTLGPTGTTFSGWLAIMDGR